jgi:hypothetical protein
MRGGPADAGLADEGRGRLRKSNRGYQLLTEVLFLQEYLLK